MSENLEITNPIQFNQDDFEYFEFDGTKEGYEALLNFLGETKAKKVVSVGSFEYNTDGSAKRNVSHVKFFTGILNSVMIELNGMDVLFRNKYDYNIMFVARRSSFEFIKLKKSGEIPME